METVRERNGTPLFLERLTDTERGIDELVLSGSGLVVSVAGLIDPRSNEWDSAAYHTLVVGGHLYPLEIERYRRSRNAIMRIAGPVAIVEHDDRGERVERVAPFGAFVRIGRRGEWRRARPNAAPHYTLFELLRGRNASALFTVGQAAYSDSNSSDSEQLHLVVVALIAQASGSVDAQVEPLARAFGNGTVLTKSLVPEQGTLEVEGARFSITRQYVPPASDADGHHVVTVTGDSLVAGFTPGGACVSCSMRAVYFGGDQWHVTAQQR